MVEVWSKQRAITKLELPMQKPSIYNQWYSFQSSKIEHLKKKLILAYRSAAGAQA